MNSTARSLRSATRASSLPMKGQFASAALAAMVVGGVIIVGQPAPAYAAFPGANGRIVFTSTQDGGTRHIFTTTGHGILDLTGPTSPASETQPEFSPDGHELVFTRYDPAQLPNTEIFVMTASGQDRIALTRTAAGNSDPTWSPDGRRIAFVSTRSGTPEIYVMKSDGTDVKRITSGEANESELAWSPKGNRIAFVRTPAAGGDEEIYTISPTGTGLTDLSHDPNSPDTDPNWSPSGTRIVYSAGPHKDGSVGGDLWTMNANGSGQEPLNHEDNGYSSGDSPAWSPDGTMIAFAANNGTGYQHVWYVSAAGGENAPLVTNNAEGNPSDEEIDWQPGPSRIAPPRTEITSVSTSSKRHRASFTFTASGALEYQCALRKNHGRLAFHLCGSPLRYSHLKHAKYRFEVRAIGPGGRDATPAARTFMIGANK